MLQKIVFAAIATLLWYTIFTFLNLIGSVSTLASEGNAPLWYTLLILLILAPMWVLTVLRIFGYKWPKKRT